MQEVGMIVPMTFKSTLSANTNMGDRAAVNATNRVIFFIFCHLSTSIETPHQKHGQLRFT
jgi:hypothetical protein